MARLQCTCFSHYTLFINEAICGLSVGAAVQLLFGLMVPIFLIKHVVGSRVVPFIFDFDATYYYAISFLYLDDWNFWQQTALIVIVWCHLCVGLYLATRYADLRKMQGTLLLFGSRHSTARMAWLYSGGQACRTSISVPGCLKGVDGS